MARYTPRHAPRHAAPKRSLGRTAVSVVGRPLVSTSLVAAVVTSGIALSGTFEDSANADATALAFDESATASSTHESQVALEDAARVASDRSATNVQKSVVAAKADAKQKAEAAALAKKRQVAQERAARAAERKKVLENAQEDPKSVARLLLPEYGFGSGQWGCLEQLWIGESDWRWWAENSSSGAYGIPQSLPASKMSSVASDWRTNPVTQIKWGLDYIKRSYGTPCNALSQWQARSPHWY